MTPVPTSQEVTELVKRYYSNYGYNRGRTYRPWWVVFIVVVPIIIILLLCCSFRRRNFKRKSQGMAPVPYTGWTTYQWNGNNQQNQQQPYYKPEGGQQYDYNNQPNSNTYNQPPNYYQTTGNARDSGVNDTAYQRPEGPPPGHNEPTYPQNAYTKS